MNWEVITYGGGDMLRIVFNAIASFFGNQDYFYAMRSAMLVSFLAILFKAAFSRDILQNFQWMMAVIIFCFVSFVPKVDVIVKDRVIPTNTAVVSNVPFGLAVTAGVFSFTGDWFSRQFETVFSMPSQVNYTTNGLLFSSKLFKNASEMTFPSGRIDKNFKSFFNTCVVIDAIGHGRMGWNELSTSDDLISLFGNKTAQNAAFFSYTDSSGTTTLEKCRSGFLNKLKPEIENSYQQTIKYGLSSSFISHFNGTAYAVQKMNNDMQASIGFLTGSSQTAQKFIIQQSIMNSMASGVHTLSREVSMPELTSFIESGANLRRISNYQSLGSIASEKLPMLKIIFETIIYAVFPIIVLMAMLNPAKVVLGYITVLVWINLWAPMFAILHFITSYYSASSMTDITNLYGGGFNMLSSRDLQKYNADVIATVGFIGSAIPMIAYMLVSRSGAMMASLAGRVMQGYDQSVDHEVNKMVDGNMQRLGHDLKMTSEGNIQNQAVNNMGSTVTSTGSGGTVIKQNGSDVMITPQDVKQMMQSEKQDLSSAVEKVDSAQTALTQSTSSTLNATNAVIDNLKQSQSGTQTWQATESAIRQQVSTALHNAVENYKKSSGVDLSEVDSEKMVAAATARFSASAGFSVPFGGVKATAETSGGVENSNMEVRRDSTAYNKAENFMKSKQYSDAVSNIGTAVAGYASQVGSSIDSGKMDTLQSNLSDLESSARTYTSATSEKEVASQSLSNAKMISSSLSSDGSQAMVDNLISKYGDASYVDGLIRQAAAGDNDAIDKIAAAAPNAGTNYMDSDFKANQMDALAQQGMSAVNSNYRSGVEDTRSHNTDSERVVDSNSHVSRSSAEQAIEKGKSLTQSGMSDPGGLITNDTAYKAGAGARTDVEEGQIEVEGSLTIERMEEDDQESSPEQISRAR